MSEEKKPETTVEEPAASAKRPRTSQQQRRQQSALRYITILFGAAFVLLLFTFLMERRQTEALMQENQEQIETLQQSVSAVQSLKNLYAENEALKQELDQLKTERNVLSGYVTNVELSLDNAKKGLEAMDWFWQIDEAYVKGRYALCRNLINSLDQAGLADYLPKESATENNRFSPADRLAEIRGIVF